MTESKQIVRVIAVPDDLIQAVMDRAEQIEHPIPWEVAEKLAIKIANDRSDGSS